MNAQQVPDIVVQSGHISRIFKCCFSPDGNLLLTTSLDETLRLWDLRLGCELRVMTGHHGPVYDACFSPDGSLIASVSFDRTLRLWDAVTGETRAVFANLPRHLFKVHFDSSGELITAGGDGEITRGKNKQEYSFDIYVWNVQAGQRVREFHFPLFSLVSRMDFLTLQKGTVLATCGQKKDILFLHDIASGNEIAQIKVGSVQNRNAVDPNVVIQLVITPDNRALILFSSQVPPQLVNLASRKMIGKLPTPSPYDHVQVMPDGTLAGFTGRSVELWDLRKPSMIKTIPVAAETLSPDLQLAAGVDNLKIVLWDVASGTEIRRMGSDLEMREFYGNTSRMFSLASNPLFPMIATGSPDGFIRIWDLRSGKGPIIRKAHEGRVNALAFNPAGTQLASGSNTGNIKLWHPFTGLQIAEAGNVKKQVGPPVESLGFSEDGHYLVADTQNYWEYFDLQQEQGRSVEHPINPFPGSGIVFYRDNTHFFTTLLDQLAYWDVGDDEPQVFSPEVPSDDLKVAGLEFILAIQGGMMELKMEPIITAMAANSNGQIALAYGYFKWVHEGFVHNSPKFQIDKPALVTILNPASMKMKHLRGGSPYVRSIAINSEGDRVATSCSDGTVTLWNLAAGKKPITWQAHSSDVSGIAFTSDGRFLATIGLDSAVRLWNPDTRELAATMVSLNDSDYVIVAAGNFYTATRGALSSVVFHLGQRALPFDQFDLSLNRPDRVHDSLGYVNSDIIDSYELAYRHRLRRFGFTPEQVIAGYDLPTLTLLSEPPPIAVPERDLSLRVKATSSGSDLERLLVYVNDVPVPGSLGIDLRGSGKSAERTIDINLSAGNNKIQLSALNSAGVESLRETFQVSYTGESAKPNLYVLAVGVSEYQRPEFCLKYAGKDARDLAAAIETLQTHFASVKSQVLSDRKASKAAILASRNFLAQSSIDDQVILFFAGHGILSGSNYYFLPTDFDPAAVEATGLRYDEIEGLLDAIPARCRLVLLDTCHAGETDTIVPTSQEVQSTVKATQVSTFRQVELFTDRPKRLRPAPGATDRVLAELFADLRRSSGAFIIAASGASEYAIETARFKNGVFTHCVLKALRQSHADRNKDNLIRVSELHSYVSEQVEALTGGLQRPISRRENLTNDFTVI